MIRTLVKFILITALLAKKYLIEVGDKAGDTGDGVDHGDYSSPSNIEMKEYGQCNIIIGSIFGEFDISDVSEFQGRNRIRSRRRGRRNWDHKKYVGDSIMLCCEVSSHLMINKIVDDAKHSFFTLLMLIS